LIFIILVQVLLPVTFCVLPVVLARIDTLPTTVVTGNLPQDTRPDGSSRSWSTARLLCFKLCYHFVYVSKVRCRVTTAALTIVLIVMIDDYTCLHTAHDWRSFLYIHDRIRTEILGFFLVGIDQTNVWHMDFWVDFMMYDFTLHC